MSNDEIKVDDPEKTPEEVRAAIEAAPTPLEGPKPWERATGGEAYNLTGQCLAKALLIVADKDPSLLKVSEDEDSWDQAENKKLWEAAKQEFPGLSNWLGGPTSFQYGWAHNLVRYIHEVDAVGNPAVVEVTSKDGEEDS